MKIQARSRLVASRSNPTDGGASFDMLNDGRLDAPSEVQELTDDDGSTEPSEDQNLLNDDLPIDR